MAQQLLRRVDDNVPEPLDAARPQRKRVHLRALPSRSRRGPFDILNDIQARAALAAALGCRIRRFTSWRTLMTRAYNVVDADGHILEPLDLWDNYMDPKFRDRAPRIAKGDNGKERLIIEEHAVG